MKNQPTKRKTSPQQDQSEAVIVAIIETIRSLARRVDLLNSSCLCNISVLAQQINANYKKQSRLSLKVDAPVKKTPDAIECLLPIQRYLNTGKYFDESEIKVDHPTVNIVKQKPAKVATAEQSKEKKTILTNQSQVFQEGDSIFKDDDEEVKPIPAKIEKPKVSPRINPLYSTLQAQRIKYSPLRSLSPNNQLTQPVKKAQKPTQKIIQKALQSQNPFEAENIFQLPPQSETPSPLQYNLKPRSPNFVEVDAPKIIRVSAPFKNKRSFVYLQPLNLAQIAEMLGQRLPVFMFTCRILFKQTLQGQLTEYEMQRQSVVNQIAELENQQSNFGISLQTRQEFLSITREDWKNAVMNVQRCKVKDTTILKLYFTCLDRIEHLDVDSDQFLNQVKAYMTSKPLPACLDPKLFNLTKSNCERIRQLLFKLQQNQVVDASPPSTWVEALTNILFEVLQFAKIIPNNKSDKREEIDELKNIALALEGIRNNLIDFRNLIQ